MRRSGGRPPTPCPTPLSRPMARRPGRLDSTSFFPQRILHFPAPMATRISSLTALPRIRTPYRVRLSPACGGLTQRYHSPRRTGEYRLRVPHRRGVVGLSSPVASDLHPIHGEAVGSGERGIVSGRRFRVPSRGIRRSSGEASGESSIPMPLTRVQGHFPLSYLPLVRISIHVPF